jgi:hypothetical protein
MLSVDASNSEGRQTMSFTLKRAITFLGVLLVMTAVYSQPVGAKDVDQHPGRHIVPMAVNIDCFIPAGQEQCVGNSPTIPAGKVFVIETVVASGERLSTGNLSAFVGLTTGGTQAGFPLSWINQGVGVPGFAGRFLMSGPMATRFYADGGTAISVSAISGAGDFFTVTLSGHLITCDVSAGCALR